jgi:hypothetical protein
MNDVINFLRHQSGKDDDVIETKRLFPKVRQMTLELVSFSERGEY